jgi:hypothetical protein
VTNRRMARPDWETDDLDLTAYEWLKVGAGSVIAVVLIGAFLILLSFAGPV